MRLDALWIVEYATNHGDFGTGVAVLIGGRIYGGDTHYCYEGGYECVDGEVRARVALHLHSGRPSPGCGAEDLVVELRGRPIAGELELNGNLEEEPLTKLFVHMLPHSDIRDDRDEHINPPDRGHALEQVVTPEASAAPAQAYLIRESSDTPPMY